MATVTGNATKTFTLWPKNMTNIEIGPRKKCEIETFKTDMSFPMITFTTCPVSMATLVVFIILVSYVPLSQFIARCHGNQKRRNLANKCEKTFFAHSYIQ